MPMDQRFWGISGVIACKTAKRRLESPWTAGTAILMAVKSDLDWLEAVSIEA